MDMGWIAVATGGPERPARSLLRQCGLQWSHRPDHAVWRREWVDDRRLVGVGWKRMDGLGHSQSVRQSALGIDASLGTSRELQRGDAADRRDGRRERENGGACGRGGGDESSNYLFTAAGRSHGLWERSSGDWRDSAAEWLLWHFVRVVRQWNQRGRRQLCRRWHDERCVLRDLPGLRRDDPIKNSPIGGGKTTGVHGTTAVDVRLRWNGGDASSRSRQWISGVSVAEEWATDPRGHQSGLEHRFLCSR